MPELPDVVVYLESIDRHIVGHELQKVRVKAISLLQTFDPPISAIEGQVVRGTRRLGKRLVFEFDDDLFLVIHLMVAGRLRWRDAGVKLGKIGLAAFEFEHGAMLLTEASTKKRASMWVVRGLTSQNRTLKRMLTMPSVFSGIGNAYSDEILVHAGLSPVQRTGNLSDEEIDRLYEFTQSTLIEWTDRLRDDVGEGFPEEVTAFRPEMVVHGKGGEACLICGTEVQRIKYASNEVNYCPRCQTGGKILADRSLSRLLKDDWPKTIEELEAS